MWHVWGRAYGILVDRPERGDLEDLRVDGKITVKIDVQESDSGMDWIDLTQERNK
jgi:hypothetical protein